MSTYDLFDLTGLPFDESRETGKSVRTAIEKKEKELHGMLGTLSSSLQRKEINEQLAFLSEKKAEIFLSSGKLNQRYKALAEERVNREIENLKSVASMMRLSGKRAVTNGAIRTYKVKSKLSKENVEKVFREAGLTIVELNPLAAMPKFPTNAAQISAELAALRKMKDPNPLGADPALATDLYAFIAYLEGEPKNAAEYRRKPVEELYALCDGHSRRFSSRNDDLGKVCAMLASAGKTNVFDSQANRDAYDAYMLYQGKELANLFALLKQASKSDLMDAQFAEVCIKRIAAVFPEKDVALAIYNLEAGLRSDPYLPETLVFYAKCASCLNLSEFADDAEAKKANKCSFCGKALYQPCPRCGEHVLVAVERCPACGFSFADTMMFHTYFQKSEDALRRCDFSLARHQLERAQSADPWQKAKIEGLAHRIEVEEKRFEQPLSQLRNAIAKKQFQAASGITAHIMSSCPSFHIAPFETQIQMALSKARSLFANSKRLNAPQRAEACLDILDICRDFTPAIDFLRATPPQALKQLTIVLDTAKCSATISWPGSTERGVTYRVVRKPGKISPQSEFAGVVVADDITTCDHLDQSLQPGIWYSYAVFAKRMGVCSDGVGNTVVLLADVTNVRYELEDNTALLTWRVPKNCAGVTISRALEGGTRVLSQNARESYEDHNLSYGKTYAYTLRANYHGFQPSEGVTVFVTPTEKLRPFALTVHPVSDNWFHVVWELMRIDTTIRIQVNQKTVYERKSRLNCCDIELPANGVFTIKAAASSGDGWVAAKNCVKLDTLSSCEIDENSSAVRESPSAEADAATHIELEMKLTEPIPKNVITFWYVVRPGPASSSHPPWLHADEVATAPDVYRVSIAVYLQTGRLRYCGIAKDVESYYVTLFTVYSIGGQEVISAPSYRRINRTLAVTLFWSVTQTLFGKWRIQLDMQSNLPISHLPILVLCVGEQGRHLAAYTDVNARILTRIPSESFRSPIKAHHREWELGLPVPAYPKKKNSLFLFLEDANDNVHYTLRWAEGFYGKV